MFFVNFPCYSMGNWHFFTFCRFPCYSMGILHFVNSPCYSMRSFGGGMDGQTDKWTDGRKDGQTDIWTDGRTEDGQTDGWMDGQTEGWSDGRTDRWTDSRKDGRMYMIFFAPVSYRTLALWGHYPKRLPQPLGRSSDAKDDQKRGKI